VYVMNRFTIVLSCIAFSFAGQLAFAQMLGVRITKHNTSVLVSRSPSAGILNAQGTPLMSWLAWERQVELNFAATFPEAELLVPAVQFIFKRNCHDYAWGPFMSCMCTTGGEQREAWWMNEPGANWSDGSMVDGVLSVQGGLGEPTADYLFNSTDLLSLNSYTDVLNNRIGLPVCPLASLNDVPVHSAVLVGWFEPDPVGLPDLSAGIYVSKWGEFGLYRHRWGIGYVPDGFLDATLLRVFVPNPPWPFCPPYDIVHSPWGF
jgi:hypothetical protein